MSDTPDVDRRTVMRAIGGTAVAVSLAGCASDDGEPAADDDEPAADDDEQDAGTVPEAVDTFLTDNDATGYDGEIVDHTGEDAVSIDVGAGDIGFAFDPVAVRVDSGTTVTWEWTGEGGDHNVVAADESDFDVDPEPELLAEAGHTAEETFEEAGNYLYVCTPHVGNGKVGAVVVE